MTPTDDDMKVARILRKNFARYLASAYLADPSEIARACDEDIDQSGELLGYVREEAAAIRAGKKG